MSLINLMTTSMSQPAGVGSPPHEHALTLEALRHALSSADAAVSTIYTRQTFTSDPPGRPRTNSRIVAISRDGRLYHYHAHGMSGTRPGTDLFRKENFLNRDEGYTVFPSMRAVKTYTSRDGQELPNGAFGCYLPAVGHWPATYWRTPEIHGYPCTLDSLARAPDLSYHGPQSVNGVECHVLRRGEGEHIHVAAGSLPYIVRRRYTSAQGETLLQYDMFEHQRVSPDTSLPRVLKVTMRAPAAKMAAEPDSDLTGTIVIDDLRVNSVDREVFQYRPQPGTLLLADSGRKQIEPGGTELISEMLAEWRLLGGRPHEASSRMGPDLLLGIGFALAIACGIWRARGPRKRVPRDLQ